MNPSEYPPFCPPEHLAAKSSRDWSAHEAGEFFDWQQTVSPVRTEFMLLFLDYELTGDAKHDLLQLGETVSILFPKDGWSQPQPNGNRGLTSRGYALAADMGLLIAELLLDELGNKVSWKTRRRPKGDISYNIPVMTGFKKLELEPIGGSIAEADGILLGHSTPDGWAQIFTYWSQNVD